MLFMDDKLESVYDFGNTVSDSDASLKCLAKEISEVTQKMAEMDSRIRFRHTDNHKERMYVRAFMSGGEENIISRTPDEISQILYRNGRTSTISGFLANLGIEKPEEDTSDFKEYLQLLYFFYMMRYFAFEDDSFFRMATKTPTSELSPIDGASQGKYLWFVLENLMDDKDSYEIFVNQDFGYSTMISIITDRINRYISEASFNENDKRAQEIDKVIDGCEEVSPREWNGGIILRVMDAVYQYQMLAYSKDMLRNLTEKERPFDFPEIEIEAPLKTWKERTLEYDEIEGFLKEKEVATFCTQNNELNRPDKALRNGPTEIVKYVFNKDQEQNTHLFIQKDETGKVRIPALIAVIITKTYLDIGNEKLLVDIKKHNGWDHDVTFRNALASSDGVCRLKCASDLAYRLFVVAFHSELLNVKYGHGYWPVLFRPIYLRNYIYVQKCVNSAFSGRNPNEWRDRLHYYITNLPGNGLEEL